MNKKLLIFCVVLSTIMSCSDVSGELAFAILPPQIEDPSPKLQIISDQVENGQHQVRSVLRSPRGGNIIELFIPLRSLVSIRVSDYTFEPTLVSDYPYFYLACHGCDGLEVEMIFDNLEPVELLIADHSLGLPPVSTDFVRNRPSPTAPIGFGDQTILARRILIGGGK